ncbi:MAG: response regulator [Nitrospirales bacterium]
MIEILLVEDHEVVRIGLRTVLAQHPDFTIVAEVGTVEAATQEGINLQPHIVLMDLRLPDGSGVDACRAILEACPNTRILFLTSYRDEDSMLAAILAGASGYLLKEVSPDRLIQAIELVADGHSILDHEVIKKVKSWVQKKTQPSTPAKKWDLSPQQFRVLEQVAEGKTNKEIGRVLGLSDKTVRNYLATIFEKLQITRRSQAAAMFIRQHLKDTATVEV